MVASRQVEIPLYRGVGQQRIRGFGALAQDIGRTAIHFWRKYIVRAAKRVSAELMQFAAPENAEIVSGRKNFKTAAKSVGRQFLREQLGSGSRKRTASIVISTKSAKQISRSRRDIFTNISHYSCQVVFGTNPLWQFLETLEGKSHEQTFEFQTDRNYYVDLRQTYLALKLKLVRGRGYETYNSKEVKKEHKEDAKRERKRRRQKTLQFLSLLM